MPGLVAGTCEFHDQDGVLGRQADQRDDADLGIDVIGIAANPDGEQRSEQTERQRQQDGERYRPALVQGGQKQEDQHGGETEDEALVTLRLFFLVGGPGPFVAVTGGKGGCSRMLHGLDRLAAAVAGGGSANQLHRPVPVVAIDHLGPGCGRDGGKGAQRDHVAAAGADVEAVDVARLGTEFRLGLNHHLPGASKHVEVVHVEPAEERLQGVVRVGDGNAQGLDLIEVEIHFVGRDIGAEGVDHVSNLGPFAGGLGRRVGHLRQIFDAHAGTVLEHELESSGGAQSLDGRLAEGVGDGFRHPRRGPLNVGDNAAKIQVRSGALVPRFQTGDHGGDIRAGGAGGDVDAA